MGISKKLIYNKYNEFWTIRDAGAGFTGRYLSLIQSVGMWGVIIKVLFNIELSVMGKWLVILIIINLASDFLVGYFYLKSGLWEYTSKFGATKQHINPAFVEMIETLKTICKKLKIKHKFKDL